VPVVTEDPADFDDMAERSAWAIGEDIHVPRKPDAAAMGEAS
jgi:hypothetical protein